MKIYPAIDLRGGNCVRLVKGDFNQETVYSTNPAEMAEKWAAAGAEYLHVVDLDGAVAGTSQNLEAIRSIVATGKMQVEVGGGIRDMEGIKRLLDVGVKQVILGSAAVSNPELVAEACQKYPGQIVVGIDVKDGKVAVKGWLETENITAKELAIKMKALGVTRIIFTDISRDGMLQGVNVNATGELARETGMEITASGGVKNLDDLVAVKAAGLEGCIIGKALYTGAIDLEEAVKLAKEA